MKQESGKVILASKSPRRSEIMERAGYKFRVIPSTFEENLGVFFTFNFIEDLAYQKAKSVFDALDEPTTVIGADTLVVLDNKIFGKPQSPVHAHAMLRELSGKTHMVVTAIAVVDDKARTKSTVSYVTFEDLTDEQIDYYIENFKPFDKAGSYGIQEMPDGYIKSYEGSFENIMGLCPKALAQLLPCTG